MNEWMYVCMDEWMDGWMDTSWKKIYEWGLAMPTPKSIPATLFMYSRAGQHATATEGVKSENDSSDGNSSSSCTGAEARGKQLALGVCDSNSNERGHGQQSVWKDGRHPVALKVAYIQKLYWCIHGAFV
jgi:hypothetical protein